MQSITSWKYTNYMFDIALMNFSYKQIETDTKFIGFPCGWIRPVQDICESDDSVREKWYVQKLTIFLQLNL